MLTTIEPDDQRKRGHDLEIDQRLHADAADLLHVLHAGDAVHDGAEDDRRDEHLDQLDEPVAERLHRLAELRVEMTQQDAEHDRGKHLHIEMRVKRLVRGIGSRRKCRIHGLPPYYSTPVGVSTSHNVPCRHSIRAGAYRSGTG